MSKKSSALQVIDTNLKLLREKYFQLENSSDTAAFDLCRRQLFVLEEIASYVDSYEWLGTIPKEGVKMGGVLEKVKFIRESYYDYNLVRQHFDLSADAMKSLMFRINKKLLDKIGEDTLDLVLSRYDKVSLGLMQFRIKSGKYKMSEILLPDFYGLLPEPKLDFYKIENCETEIKTLYQFSRFGMQELLNNCDSSKLAFLLFILQNTTERYKEEQKDLVSLLMGINWSIDDYLKKLSELRGEDIYSVFEDNSYADNEVSIPQEEVVESSFEEENVEEDFVPLNDETDFDFSFLKEGTDESEEEVLELTDRVKIDNSSVIWGESSIKETLEEEDDDDILEDL